MPYSSIRNARPAGLALLAALAAAGCVRARDVGSARSVPTPQMLADHCREHVGAPRIEQVTDQIWVARGFDLANTTLIRTAAGNVIVDPGMDMERARAARKALLAASPGPVTAIIFTHSHIDHIAATAVYQEPGTQIWATAAFLEHFVKQYGIFQQAELRRGARQFGRHFGDEDIPCSALGPRANVALVEAGIRMPTHTFSGQTTIEIGGTTIELVEAHGETHDQLFVWLPGQRVLLPGDNFYYAFPNLYTIRGTSPRPVAAWIASIDNMRRYQPDVLIPSHTSWLAGREAIAAVLRDYRDGIQWVRDHVVRGANAGRPLHEILATVGLPPHLRAQPALRELYGQLDWSARAIYTNELGWFDGDPANLYPPDAVTTASREIAMMGGKTSVADAAAKALAAGDPRWAVHLYRKLLTAAGEDPEAVVWRAGLAKALVASAAVVANSNGRAYLLESAYELEHGGYVPTPQPRLPDELLLEIPLDVFFTAMAGRLIPERAVDVHESVVFEIPGEGRRYVLTVRRGIVELSVGEALPDTPQPLATVTVDGLTWRRLALQLDGPTGALARGDLRISGSKIAFLRFIDRFERGL